MNLSAPADNSEYGVNTSAPTAGGTVVLSFDVWSKKIGTWHSDASMTSDTTPGVTTVARL